MSIDELIPDESAIVELRGDSADAILAELAELLARRLDLVPGPLLAQLREREGLGSTAIGRGLALPHARANVGRSSGVLGIAREGVEFGAPDAGPVFVFLGLVSPPQPNEHLRALACVSRCFSDPATADRIRACADAAAILALLHGSST